MDNNLYKEMARIDEKMWARYNGTADLKCPEDQRAIGWLKADILSILVDANDLDATMEEIKAMLNTSEMTDDLLHAISLSDCREDAIIRKDWPGSLKKYDVHALASKVGYSFFGSDITALATLHKRNRFRRKIENLLEDTNFHYECGKFMAHEYEEFLSA